jgi:hypothetical protein
MLRLWLLPEIVFWILRTAIRAAIALRRASLDVEKLHRSGSWDTPYATARQLGNSAGKSTAFPSARRHKTQVQYLLSEAYFGESSAPSVLSMARTLENRVAPWERLAFLGSACPISKVHFQPVGLAVRKTWYWMPLGSMAGTTQGRTVTNYFSVKIEQVE